MQQPISNRSNIFELNNLFLFVRRLSFMQKSAEIVVLLRTVEKFSIVSGCPSNLYNRGPINRHLFNRHLVKISRTTPHNPQELGPN